MANKYLTKNFTVNELKCRGTGGCDMSQSFMERLQLIRDDFGRPLFPTSGFRHPDYNETVSTTGRTGPHTTGHAVDIQIFGAEALKLIEIAQAHGLTSAQFMELSMTGLEAMILKELVTWGAKMVFDAVQDDGNSLTADQAKQHSKNALSALTEEAQKAIIDNLPRHLKL